MKKFLLGSLIIMVGIMGVGHANKAMASFVYTRTPGGNIVVSPIEVRVQGVFGVDFCTDPRQTQYKVDYYGQGHTSTPWTHHAQGDPVNDTFQVGIQPGSYTQITIQCNNDAMNAFGYFFVDTPFTVVPAIPTIVNYGQLPTGTINHSYSNQLNVSGGISPYTFAIASGNLPLGLSVDPSIGVISGTPSAVGIFSFAVKVTDSNMTTHVQSFILVVASQSTTGFVYTRTPGGGIITSPVVTHIQGVFGVDFCTDPRQTQYRVTYYGQGIGSTPWTFHAQGDVVDDTFHVDLSPANYSVVYVLCDDTTLSAPAQTYFTVDNAFTVITALPPIITTSLLSTTTVGANYSQTIQTSGGTLPFNWTVTSGSLPPGLSLNSSTGGISGTSTTAGSYDFTVQVTDANNQTATQDLTIVVNPAPIITTTSVPAGTGGANYSQFIDGSGGTGGLSWSIFNGNLPPGLALNNFTGEISGVPTTPGTYDFTAQVTDTNSVSATQNFSIVVNSPPTITTTSVPSGTTGTNYSQTLQSIGGTLPITWSVTSGDLPSGVTLDSSTGILSGTLGTPGVYTFTVQANDINSATASQALTITVNSTPSITTASLSAGTISATYSQVVIVSGGTALLTWSISSGNLPNGLSLNSSTGEISGIPTTAGSYDFTVQITDANSVSATKDLSILVNPAVAITTNSVLQDATVGAAYSQTLQATGGTNPLSWSVSTGNLPFGLTLGTSGLLSGTPTVAGSFNFTVEVTDANSQSAFQAQSIIVNPVPAITTSSLVDGIVGIVYSQTLTSTGGTIPLMWSISSGTLPAGLSLSSSGNISGTPTANGTYNFTVQVADAYSVTATQALSITVNPTLNSLSPANVWIGLKNSDDIGTKFDLLAEILKDGVVVGSGQLNGVNGGSSGFNNAFNDSVALALSSNPVIVSGDVLTLRLFVRISTAVSGHNSGTARLWFNDSQANSNFGATIGTVNKTYYLLGGSLLGNNPGPSPKQTSDIFVSKSVGGNPFKSFGTWNFVMP